MSFPINYITYLQKICFFYAHLKYTHRTSFNLIIFSTDCSFFLALKIHVSPSTKEVLDSFGTFELELRGEVEMKVGFRLMIPYKSFNCL